MPLIQGGPPEGIWERTADPLKWSIIPSEHDKETIYELRVDCGMGIMRLQFFTEDEIRSLRGVIDERLP
jgi:hypothetical protein